MNLHYDLYMDYDGVLVNFKQGVLEVTGHSTIRDGKLYKGQIQRERTMAIENAGVNFWANLQPMPDFNELWDFVKRYDPHILTATPPWNQPVVVQHAIAGKTQWNEQYTKVPPERLHIVERDSKSYFATNEGRRPNVLVDDFDENIQAWKEAGGIGIFHTSAKDTIEKLRELGYT